MAMPRVLRCAVLIAGAILIAAPAAAQTLLRVGKSVPEAFSFVPLDIGMRNGMFRKYGVEIRKFGARRRRAPAAGDGRRWH